VEGIITFPFSLKKGRGGGAGTGGGAGVGCKFYTLKTQEILLTKLNY